MREPTTSKWHDFNTWEKRTECSLQKKKGAVQKQRCRTACLVEIGPIFLSQAQDLDKIWHTFTNLDSNKHNKSDSHFPTHCRLELHDFGEDNNDWHTWRVSNLNDLNGPSCHHLGFKKPELSWPEKHPNVQREVQHNHGTNHNLKQKKLSSEQLHLWWKFWCSFWWTMPNLHKNIWNMMKQILVQTRKTVSAAKAGFGEGAESSLSLSKCCAAFEIR